MTIEPVLPLAISISEGRGTCALFLGSGISKSAGIPTGFELIEKTKRKLYAMDRTVETINEEDYLQWVNVKSIESMNYSDLLELFPSEEDRRVFLEPFFVGVEPTESHRSIALMVKNGLIKVIITSNFDRLMETALDELKVNYDVVDSPHDLKTLKPREHSNCRILKIHGDYKSIIKNTQKELEQLEPDIEVEFQTILNNFGIIVAGYSGSDEGVMSCLKKRNSKYTLYWLKHSQLDDNINDLIKKQDGRAINIKSSDSFFIDLMNKVNYYSSYETGDTPEYLMHVTKTFIKDYNIVDYRETLKKQMNILDNEWVNIYNTLAKDYKADPKKILEGFKEFERYVDSITAIGLVLVEYSHDFIDYYFRKFQDIYDLSLITFSRERIANISDFPKSALFNLYHTMGAFSLKEENLSPLNTLLNEKIVLRDYGQIESEFIWQTDVFYPYTFGRDNEEIFRFLIDSYDQKPFLKDFFKSKTDFRIHVCQFNLIQCLYASKLSLDYNSESYGFNPYFSKYRNLNEEIKIPLLKCKDNPIYLSEMSKAFNENSKQFKGGYNERIKTINDVIVAQHNMFGSKLPENIFNNE